MRILAGFLVFISLLVVASTHLIVKQMFQPRLDAHHKKFQRLAPKIRADLELLNQNSPFEDSRYEKDAHDVIDQFITWEGANSDLAAEGVRTLFARYSYWRSAPGHLKQLMADSDFDRLPVDWVNILYKYDHWRLPSKPEYEANLQNMPAMNGLERVVARSKLGLPNYQDLRQWAILNLLRKQKVQQGLGGLHAYRQVAELIHSTGTLVGNNVAAAMLMDEAFFVQTFKISGWVLVPESVINAYRRVTWAWPGIARAPWFAAFPKEFEAYLYPRFGVCAVALEMGAGIPGLQDFLEPQFPLEPNYAENVKRVREFHHRLLERCNLKEYAGVFGPTPDGANDFLNLMDPVETVVLKNYPAAKYMSGLNYSRVPFLRRILGMILMTVAMPDYFQLYEKPKGGA